MKKKLLYIFLAVCACIQVQAQTWSALGTGATTPNAQIKAIAVNGNEVYAGGLFDTIGGIAASNIAKWNGSTWAPVRSHLYDDSV